MTYLHNLFNHDRLAIIGNLSRGAFYPFYLEIGSIRAIDKN